MTQSNLNLQEHIENKITRDIINNIESCDLILLTPPFFEGLTFKGIPIRLVSEEEYMDLDFELAHAGDRGKTVLYYSSESKEFKIERGRK